LRYPVPLTLLPQRLAADPQELRRPALVAAGIGEGAADLLLLDREERPWPALEDRVRRRRVEGQRGVGGEDQGALERVAELAEVARPGMLAHPGEGAGREGEIGTVEALSQVGHQLGGEDGEVRAPLAERRQPEGEHLE